MLNVHCVLCILKVEMLRMKMEGMSKGMRERMAEYTRRLEAVASGDNAAGCQSRKCGGRHSRKASAGSQRSWSGGSTASNGNAPWALDAAAHGRTRHAAAAENRHQQQQHKVQFKLKPPSLFSSSIHYSSLAAWIFLASSVSMISSERFAVSLGRPDVVDLGALLVSGSHST